MIVPIVNLNGTSREELKEQFLEANRKAGELLKALAYAMPHGRDYQTAKDPMAFSQAAKEHTARLEAVRQIQNEMMHLAMAVEEGQ